MNFDDLTKEEIAVRNMSASERRKMLSEWSETAKGKAAVERWEQQTKQVWPGRKR